MGTSKLICLIDKICAYSQLSPLATISEMVTLARRPLKGVKE
jgi:hypothetical protein